MTIVLTPDRPQLLERAVDLASVEGLEGLSITGLAGDLDASAREFDQFESDEHLQLAVWETAIQVFVARVLVPARDLETGRPQLEALCECYLDFIASDVLPGGCFMATVSAEFDNRPGRLRDAVAKSMRGWMDALAFMAEGAGAANPRQVAFQVQSIGQGANQNYQLFGDRTIFDCARAAVARTLDQELPAAPNQP